MGIFDALSPAFSGFDDLISPFTNPLIRVVFWAIISALITSLIFKKLSNPTKISALKIKLKAYQNELNNHEGDFSELKVIAVQTIKTSIKRMGMTFLPAMLASIPIVFILAYLSNNYGLVTPDKDEVVPIKLTLEEGVEGYSFVLIKNKTIKANGNIDHIDWPTQDQPSQLMETKINQTILELPMPVSPVVHKKQWWNSLIGNPAGYLPDSSTLSHIEFEFNHQKLITFGPDWMHGWLFVFFFMTLLFSVIFLFLFKIKF